MKASQVKVGQSVQVTKWNAKRINQVGRVVETNTFNGYVRVRIGDEVVKFHCTSLSAYTHPLSGEEIALTAPHKPVEPFSQVGQYIVLIAEFNGSGRFLGDMYEITKIGSQYTSYRFVSGHTPLGGWRTGTLRNEQMAAFWEMASC